ncbi:MAG: IclR family transcriptional regulator [Kiritimatiellaeota bacterium]|nr:IclR family transcriptional regulator [Kiritimatiellota bacterium]
MNNTLRNGFKVLQVLASTEEMLSVTQIAEAMGVPNSHACRLLKTLSEAGYIEQDPKSRLYGISLKILSLSNLCLTKNIIRQKVKPFLLRLSKQRQINTYLSVCIENRPMIIDAIYFSAQHSTDSALDIGTLNPIHCSASGKVAAAYHPPDDLDAFLEKCPFKKCTDQTITSKKKFIESLPEIRERKVALAIYERGKSVVAAASPVFNVNGELAGIIGAQMPPKENYEHEEISEYAGAVRETAEAASFSLGFAEYDGH